MKNTRQTLIASILSCSLTLLGMPASAAAPAPDAELIAALAQLPSVEFYLQAMELDHSQEDIAFLRGKLTEAGLDLSKPLPVSVAGDTVNFIIGKNAAEARLTPNGLVYNGLVFKFDSGKSVTENYYNYEKRLKAEHASFTLFKRAYAADLPNKLTGQSKILGGGLTALGALVLMVTIPVTTPAALVIGGVAAAVTLGIYILDRGTGESRAADVIQNLSQFACLSGGGVTMSFTNGSQLVFPGGGEYQLIQKDKTVLAPKKDPNRAGHLSSLNYLVAICKKGPAAVRKANAEIQAAKAKITSGASKSNVRGNGKSQ